VILVPLMKNPAASVKEYSVSQYPRSNATAENERLGYADANAMGYSIRTKQYRYTMWMSNGFRSSKAFDSKLIIGTELYDYKKDPLETVNIVSDKKVSNQSQQLYNQVVQFFKLQEVK
jgi:hypothetical protein